jgi:hypothetical protein
MASYSQRKSIIFEFQRCHLHPWNNFRGVIDTAETISVVPLTPLKWWWLSEKFHRDINYRIFVFTEFQPCPWHRWNLKQNLQDLSLPLKGKSNRNTKMANIPILYKYVHPKNSWGLPRPKGIFQFSCYCKNHAKMGQISRNFAFLKNFCLHGNFHKNLTKISQKFSWKRKIHQIW